jgi:hypothetical protein
MYIYTCQKKQKFQVTSNFQSETVFKIILRVFKALNSYLWCSLIKDRFFCKYGYAFFYWTCERSNLFLRPLMVFLDILTHAFWNSDFWPRTVSDMLKRTFLTTIRSSHAETDVSDHHDTFQTCWNWLSDIPFR